MLHKTIKAASTVTDQGEFSAIAAAYSVDRGNEQIMPGAFKATIAHWQESGKNIPLHWDHESSAESIIGYVDPSSMRERPEGLYVKGKLDLENSDMAREAWRLMKDNSIGLSFGYLVEQSADGKNGVTELKALDLFEVSLTPAPMNPDTRVVSMKHVVDTETGAETEVLVFPDGVESKATWTTAYVNSLPDSSFLYVESGGEKDSEGKTTPRTLRHFPVKDDTGAVDPPHLRNALSRIPQSSLPQEVKDRLTATAQRMLDNMKRIDDAASDEPSRAKPHAQDPLTDGYDALEFARATRGIDMAEIDEPEPEPTDTTTLAEHEQKHADLMFELLTNGVDL